MIRFKNNFKNHNHQKNIHNINHFRFFTCFLLTIPCPTVRQIIYISYILCFFHTHYYFFYYYNMYMILLYNWYVCEFLKNIELYKNWLDRRTDTIKPESNRHGSMTFGTLIPLQSLPY